MYKDYFEKEYEFLPWISLSEQERAAQEVWQAALCEKYSVSFEEECVISREAHLYSVKGSFGKKNLIASHALLRCLDIETGDNCSFNSFCVVHGKVKLGSCVRIAPGAKIFGENHGFSRIDKPICTQPNTQKGITIEDDVWIGANSVITDGVTIGAHSIVAAGATVTCDVPPYSVVGGVPARVIRNRLADIKNTSSFKKEAERFAKSVRESISHILASRFENGEYTNSASDKEKRRALCDAVEIAAMLGIEVPHLTKSEIVAAIRAFQKDENEYECVLCASYALEILGEKPIEFNFVKALGDTWDYLDTLKWKNDAWDAGHYTDIYATACYMNKKHYAHPSPKELFSWLSLNQKADGLWGEGDMRLRVNGYYRLTRGSYDQFKLTPPAVREAVDSVLNYAKEKGVPDNACDALDIIHPLYMASHFTSYRKSEGEAWCVKMLPVFMERFDLRSGFSFAFGGEASLKGTEMWLSIIYLMCDYLGISEQLGYEPKGVHRVG